VSIANLSLPIVVGNRIPTMTTKPVALPRRRHGRERVTFCLKIYHCKGLQLVRPHLQEISYLYQVLSDVMLYFGAVMILKVNVCVFCMSASLLLLEQAAQAQPRPLGIVGTTVTNLVADAIAAPVKCDSDGNIALRVVRSPDGPDPNQIIRVSADGQKVIVVHVPPDGEPRDAELIDFALGRSEVFVLASSKSRPWILRYDADGKFERAARIEAKIQAMRIAVDVNENLLISGETLAESGKPTTTFLGVFGTDGTLLRRLLRPQNITPSGKGAKADSSLHDVDTVIRSSLMQAALDGNVYFLEGSTLFIVSSSGRVNSMDVSPRKELGRARALVANQHGFLGTEFVEYKPETKDHEISSVILEVIDPHTRKAVMTLTHSDRQIGSVLACYEGDEFTFVNTDDNSHLALVKTKPQ
jgi:hypothetical protein